MRHSNFSQNLLTWPAAYVQRGPSRVEGCVGIRVVPNMDHNLVGVKHVAVSRAENVGAILRVAAERPVLQISAGNIAEVVIGARVQGGCVSAAGNRMVGMPEPADQKKTTPTSAGL